MIQIDGIKRQVYIKLTDKDYMLSIINNTGGSGAYTRHTGEISRVEIAVAGIANVPPEVLDNTLRTALASIGQVLDIQNEKWARTYRYTVDNGVRQVTMVLTQHAPSHLVIAERRVLIFYDGQPTTCYGCGENGHLCPTCPRRQRRAQLPPSHAPVTYAAVAATMSHLTGGQPSANIQGQSTPGLDREVESNENIMDSPPSDPEGCNSPMDSTHGTELGNPLAPPQPFCTWTSDGSPNPSLLEVTDPPREMNDACHQTPATDAGPLPGKGDTTKSRHTHCHPLSSSQTSVRDDDTMDNMEASTRQNHQARRPPSKAQAL